MQLVNRVSLGAGGRSSVANITATIFGSTGLVGRCLVNHLGKMGYQLVIPYRNEENIKHLKPMGDLGQLDFQEFNIYDKQSLRNCVQGTDVVFNLLGRDYPTFNYNLEQSNAHSAANIAHVCALEKVPHLIHLSHICAEQDSTSEYYRSKYHGEVEVKKYFPNATIVRCSHIYGYFDRFLIYYAIMSRYGTFFPVYSPNSTRYPVSVMDVCEGLSRVVSSMGKTYDFLGYFLSN